MSCNPTWGESCSMFHKTKQHIHYSGCLVWGMPPALVLNVWLKESNPKVARCSGSWISCCHSQCLAYVRVTAPSSLFVSFMGTSTSSVLCQFITIVLCENIIKGHNSTLHIPFGERVWAKDSNAVGFFCGEQVTVKIAKDLLPGLVLLKVNWETFGLRLLLHWKYTLCG